MLTTRNQSRPVTRYAVLRPDDGSTFRAREQRFAGRLCDRTLSLSPDGLADEGTPIGDLTPTELADAVYASRRERDWTADDVVYVLVAPALLDLQTRNAFRRSLRLVFERVAPDAQFPYDQLEDVGRRAAWLTDSLEAEEIVEPSSVRRRSITGVEEDQRDVTSF